MESMSRKLVTSTHQEEVESNFALSNNLGVIVDGQSVQNGARME
jgi:hypothetical protein